MKLIESIMTNNPCYKAGKKITVLGLMLHSVGCSQPKALAFINSWNKSSYDRACVHAFIDGNDGTVYQTLPWNHRGWHGGGSSNNTHIGVEMCEPACIKYTGGSSFTCSNLEEAKAVARRTYEAAVELFAMLCKTYGLNPLADGVIISHKEGHKRGVASNHGDPEHLWNQLGMGYTMDGFRKDVNALVNKATEEPKKEEVKPVSYYRVRKTWSDAKSQKGAYKVLAYAKKCCDRNPGYYVFDSSGNAIYPTAAPKQEEEKKEEVAEFKPYMVRVKISDLNIRKGPGTNYARTKYIPKGSYTIVAESDGKGATKWGKLKSGAGWISLDFVTKL